MHRVVHIYNACNGRLSPALLRASQALLSMLDLIRGADHEADTTRPGARGQDAKRTKRADSPGGRDRLGSPHRPDRDRRNTGQGTEATGEARERLGGGEGTSGEHYRGPAPRDRGARRSGEVGVMPGHNPLSIANEFIKLNGGPPINQMKLQKLVYFAHGWNLAINGAPLISSNIEAWDGGPVVRAIWNHLRDYGHNAEGGLFGHANGKPYTAEISPAEQAVIEHVWRKYSGYTGLQLSEMTHQPGTPWANTYFGKQRNWPLSTSDIQQHFTEMAFAGRSAALRGCRSTP